MIKKFRFGFAAFIAVLAISATLASYAGAFENTKLSPQTITCYRLSSGVAPTVCGTVDLCLDNFTIPVERNSECIGTAPDACCYIVDDTQFCPDEPTKFKVTQIVCGEYAGE
ncbi:hypothetical protein [Chitinophaga cymbidii]|uniref:Uncharacterized protein n=1 Tax=Chitinophaga cymbidii TaxID=1096750 RepID=A0A512RJ34_9BACT|nr:hypothetical protein [Chitinophaga cymbidii]GEP95723.1 hypothetical protein CCY01nite_19830 [Chitinophaga cymbidii]